MKKGILENIEIIDAGAKGKAVGKTEDGRVIFVPYAVPEDNVDIKITKKRRKFLQGSVVKINKKSDKRVEPKCEHFGICGGCKWQNMNYESQLFYKQKEITENLKKFAGIEQEVKDIVPSKEIFYYRNKMEYTFSNSRWITEEEIKSEKEIEERNAVGFHIPGRWDKILDLKKCYLQDDISNKIRNRIKEIALENDYTFYDLRDHTGLLRTLMIRITSTGQIMVLIQFGEDDKTQIENILNIIGNEFSEITSLLYVVNKKQNDTIYDQDIILYKGQDFIEEEMEGLKFKINAKSFYQTNSAQAYELYKKVRDMANISKEDLVYDLYTGTGTIAFFNSKMAKKVIGIESVPEAIEDAKYNAKNNNIDNADFFVGDMKDVFDDNFLNKNGIPDIIITDPPRDGMHKKVVEQILKINPKRIVYVSCNSATQARDLEMMKEQYEVKEIQPVDMFPHTHHVENIILLERK